MTILAVDLGTSSIKLMRVDEQLAVVALDRVACPSLDDPGWLDAVRGALRGHTGTESIAAIAVTGQMHGLVPWEDNGPASGIPWTDQRGAGVLPTLRETLGPDAPKRLGGPLASGFMAVSLAWLRTHDQERWARIRRVSLPKDALIGHLTGRHVTDPSDAVGTGLLDVARGEWAWDVVDALGIPREWLPELVPSGSVVGTVTEEAARDLGLRPGIPVVIAGGDAPAGAFGAGVVAPDQALILLSTGAQVIQPSATYTPDPDGRWYTWPAAVPPDAGFSPFLRVGTLLNAGITTAWGRETLAGAGGLAPEPTGVVMLPHLIGERTPLNDPHARGAILGIGPETSPAAIARAVLEGIAFSLRHALETMTTGAPPVSIRLGGGGAHDAAWRQIITDVLGVATERVDTPDLSAYGAARLAAHALGWPETGTGSPPTACYPDPDRHRRYGELYAIYRDAVSAVAPLSRRLAAWRGHV